MDYRYWSLKNIIIGIGGIGKIDIIDDWFLWNRYRYPYKHIGQTHIVPYLFIISHSKRLYWFSIGNRNIFTNSTFIKKICMEFFCNIKFHSWNGSNLMLHIKINSIYNHYKSTLCDLTVITSVEKKLIAKSLFNWN